jgi:hypothetical protein
MYGSKLTDMASEYKIFRCKVINDLTLRYALLEVQALAAPGDRVVAADLAGHAIQDY